MKKILLTGVNGQVGHALQAVLADEYALTTLDRSQLDLTHPDAIRQAVISAAPDIIINPAAYTAVDQAETDAETAHAVNAIAPKALAEAGQSVGAAMIHFSTDYVFDGTKSSPYDENDAVNPLGVYGESKLAGEQAVQTSGMPHLILRTSWVYGAYGKNFLQTIIRLAKERDALNIVADQIGAPTNTLDIAQEVKQLLVHWDLEDQSQSGIYHFTNQGEASWHTFAQAIVRQYQSLAAEYALPTLELSADDIAPIPTEAYPTPAARPKNSRLNNEKLATTFQVKLPDWESGLARVMQRYVADQGFKRIK